MVIFSGHGGACRAALRPQVCTFPEMKRLRGLHGHTASIYAVAADRQEK